MQYINIYIPDQSTGQEEDGQIDKQMIDAMIERWMIGGNR